MRIAALAVLTLGLIATPVFAQGVESGGPVAILDVILRPGAARMGIALLSAIGAMRWIRRRNRNQL